MGKILTTRSAPYDAEIEYLESTGTQWIDTGVIPTFNTGYDVECLYSINTKTMTMLGGGNAYSKNELLIAVDFSSEAIITSKGNNTSVRVGAPNSYVNKKCNYRCNGNSFYFNGTLIGSYPVFNLNTTHTITLMCYNRNSGIGEFLVGKYYSCKLYDNSTLIRDFIPVRVGQTGYMYDRVSQTLFENQGSGNFILGKDIHWTKTLNTRIKNRYDTEENWLTENPILLSGETAFADISGIHKCKVGDGETPYTGLPYVNNMDEAMIIRKWRD